jgi:tyrosyl-tRNA synthetase
MEVKMALGHRIVSDLHSAAEADAAHEAFNREVRQGLEPADTETVDLPGAALSDKGIRVDKLLALIGLTASVTDATRKMKAGAVEINGSIQKDLLLNNVVGELTIRVGKQWKRVKVQP